MGITAIVFAHCSGGDKKLAVGEKADLIVADKKVGTIEQVSETERHLLIDKDQDGVVEKRIVMDNEKLTRIVYPQTDTNLKKEVVYSPEGVPVKVNVAENETLKGIALVESGKVTNVELPEQKKKVVFSEGALSEILDIP